MPHDPALLRRLIEIRSAFLEDLEPVDESSERLLVRCDQSGTMQLFEVVDGTRLVARTDLAEPVRATRYVPGRRQAVVEVDAGGNERGQLFLVHLERDGSGPALDGDLDALTADPAHAHHLAGVSPDGRSVAYLSNRRNGVDFDLWTIDLDTRGERCLYQGGGYCQPASGFSPDGRWVSILRPGGRSLDVDLLLVSAATGEARAVLEHADEAALVGPPVWESASAFYVSSNVGRDLAAVVRVDLEAGTTQAVAGTGEEWDAAPVFAGGGHLYVVENVDGASRFTRRAPGGHSVEVALPEPGVMHWSGLLEPRVSADGSRAYFTLTTPRMPGDVWVVEVAGAPRRVTHCASDFAPEDFARAEPGSVASFDGERLSLYCLRPVGVDRPATVVVIHGGPESQSMLTFNPVVQGLVASGYAVVVPNVRGSTGYGKRFAALDDTTRRLDSVRDLEAVREWIGEHGLDATRVALYGGSYGGYMVLAGLAFQPALWAAGVDIVGISNLVTFLENTSAYRRRFRELEYGSLETDREFLEAASPLNRADDIVAPLFVVHGRNDPRVPVGEAEQLHARLAERGVACELVIYEDEGHGLARLTNRLDATPRAVAFLDRVLA